MNIIICGAGKVGFSISKQLSAQGHSVTVIDQSSEDIKKINETQDVKGVVGRATFPSVLENAGAAMILLECVPDDLTADILEKITVPVIGIGAGQRTDGQIMVIHDLLGISCLEKSPKFVKDFLKDSSSIEEAISNYSKSVKNKSFPSEDHTFF